ncbi:TPA: PD-(D/E)XK nuclease family protein [Morganella morganii]
MVQSFFEKKYIRYHELEKQIYTGMAKGFSEERRRINYIHNKIIFLNSNGKRYNLVDIFKPNENEHSQVVADILNYNIGGENIFLSSFLLQCFKCDISFDCKKTDITSEKYRIDILVKNKEKAIIIENKINNAIDQQEQLKRYINIVKHLGIKEENIFIIYIKRRNKDIYPSDSLSVYHNSFRSRVSISSFSDDILPWLTNDVLPNIKKKDSNLFHFVSQYIDYLKFSLKKDVVTDMKINKFLIEELGLNESESDLNVRLIQDEIENINEVQNCLNKLLTEQKEKSFNRWYNMLMNDYPDLKIIRNENKEAFTKVGVLFSSGIDEFSVLVEKDSNSIYYGVSRHFTNAENYSDNIKEISKKITDSGFKESESWWYAWRYTSYESAYTELCCLIDKAVFYISSEKTKDNTK